MYPVLSEWKQVCTGVNVPFDCVDVASFLSAEQAKGSLSDAAMDQTCVSCVVGRYASRYTVEVDMDAACKLNEPPLSCAQTLTALDKINLEYVGFASAIVNGASAGAPVFLAMLVVLMALLN